MKLFSLEFSLVLYFAGFLLEIIKDEIFWFGIYLADFVLMCMIGTENTFGKGKAENKIAKQKEMPQKGVWWKAVRSMVVEWCSVLGKE